MLRTVYRNISETESTNEDNCLNSLLDNASPEYENIFNIIGHLKYCNDVDFKDMLQETIPRFAY